MIAWPVSAQVDLRFARVCTLSWMGRSPLRSMIVVIVALTWLGGYDAHQMPPCPDPAMHLGPRLVTEKHGRSCYLFVMFGLQSDGLLRRVKGVAPLAARDVGTTPPTK